METFIIIGKMESGKTTTTKLLKEKYGIYLIPPYTTRPIREEEQDGVDYHFRTEKEFERKIKSNFFASYTEYNASFGHCYYGTAIEDFQRQNAVIISNPKELKQLRNNHITNKVFYLNISEDIVRKRAIIRGDDPKEVDRRIEADKTDFAKVEELVDYIIDVPTLVAPEVIANVIIRMVG